MTGLTDRSRLLGSPGGVGMTVRVPAVVLLLLTLTACFDEAPRATSNQRIGVTAAGGNGAEVLVLLCPGEQVEAIDAYASAGPILGDEDDELIWRVEADEPVGDERLTFVVGQMPEGFAEVQPLPENALTTLPEDVLPAVIVTTSGSVDEANIAWAPAELPDDGYLDASAIAVTEADLEAGRERLCPQGS